MYQDSSSYNGDWERGMRHGHGEFVNMDGSVYRGQWANDKSHGKGTFSIPAVNYTYSGMYDVLESGYSVTHNCTSADSLADS